LNTSRSITLPSVADEFERQRALGRELEIGRAVLVAVGMAADDDRLGPSRTRRGTFLQMIGSRRMVPPRMLRMVPFGDRHIP